MERLKSQLQVLTAYSPSKMLTKNYGITKNLVHHHELAGKYFSDKKPDSYLVSRFSLCSWNEKSGDRFSLHIYEFPLSLLLAAQIPVHPY